MRRLLLILFSLILLFSNFNLAYAQERSIEKINQDSQIDNQNDSVKITYENQEALVFYGVNGIDIITETKTVHLSTDFTVLRLASLQDINNDGYEDFLTFQKAIDYGDQVLVVDGYSGKTISSLHLTHLESNDTLGVCDENSYVLRVGAYLKKGLIICDYSMYLIEPSDGSIIWQVTAQDNLWEYAIIDDVICTIDQVGNYYLINANDGTILKQEKLSNVYEVKPAYDFAEGLTCEVTCNLFDVKAIDGVFYITSEDGFVYCLASDGALLSSIELNYVDNDKIQKNFANSMSYDFLSNKTTYTPSGLINGDFKCYQIIDEYEDYLLVACYMSNKDFQGGMQYSSFNPGFVLVKKDLSEVVTKIDYGSFGPLSDAVITTYQDELAIAAVSDAGNGVHFNVFDFAGRNLFSKDVGLKMGSDVFNLERSSDGYYLQQYGNMACYISAEFNKVSYVFDFVQSGLIGYENDSLLVAVSYNGSNKEIIAYENDLKTIRWQYKLNESYPNEGFEFITTADYDNDGYVDVLTIVIEYSKNEAKASNFIFLSGKDGSVILNKRISLGKMYDEKGKPYTAYLVTRDFEVLRDLDNDHKKEISVSGQIISSKSFTIKGYINSWIDANSNLEKIGDVNNDGFVDYVAIGNGNMVIYESRLKGYQVNYVKTKTSTSLDANYKTGMGTYILKDINNDGVNEIMSSATNAAKHQYFVIYDGKTLTKMYNFEEEGTYDYECFNVLDLDINSDGYNEIWAMNSALYIPFIIDGKTGDILKVINPHQLEDEDYSDINRDDYWYPDYYVEPVFVAGSGAQPVRFMDLNNDGIEEYAIQKSYYDEDTWFYMRNLIIYDGATSKQLDVINVSVNDNDEMRSFKKVLGNERYYIIELYDDSIHLFDSESMSIICDYKIGNMGDASYFMANDKTICLMGSEEVYALNIENSFELVDQVFEQEEGKLTLSWQPLVNFSLMEIYDNNFLVYLGTDTMASLKLTNGEHLITLIMTDNYGKSSMLQLSVNVPLHKANTYWVAGLGVVVLGACLFLNLRRKQQVKRKIKEELQ